MLVILADAERIMTYLHFEIVLLKKNKDRSMVSAPGLKQFVV